MATIKIDTCKVDWSHNFSNNYKQYAYNSKVCNVWAFIVIHKEIETTDVFITNIVKI